MPVNKIPGESKDDFISRCIAIEIKSGMPEDQAAAICYAKWEEFGATASYNEPPVDINFAPWEKVSFDYDGTLSTRRGQELAKQLISQGTRVFVVSARNTKGGMLSLTGRLNIPDDRVYSVGSNVAKIAKVKELGVQRHYDNNADVVRQLGTIGHKFTSQVIFSANSDKDLIKEYLDSFWDVHLLSDTSLTNSHNKAHQIAKELGIKSDKIVMSNKNYEFDFTQGDPVMTYLLKTGKPSKEVRVLKSIELENGFDLSKISEVEAELKKDIDLKFLKVETRFSYIERPGALPAVNGSRPFCRNVLNANKMWTLDEINKMINVGFGDAKQVGAPALSNPFLYTGGFYTTPGGRRGPDTRPYCRHMWQLNLVVV